MGFVITIEPLYISSEYDYLYYNNSNTFIYEKEKATIYPTKLDCIYELFKIYGLLVKTHNIFHFIDENNYKTKCPQSYYNFKDDLIDIIEEMSKNNKKILYDGISVYSSGKFIIDFITKRPKYIVISEDGEISFTNIIEDDIMLRIIGTKVIEVPDFS